MAVHDDDSQAAREPERPRADATRVTVYDIAERAGTSASTVSRVLNGSALIAEPTRRAVLVAASELGYRSRRVRRPANRSVLNIVVFLPHAAEPQTHLFYDAAALFSGIQSGLGDVRAHTIVALADTAGGALSPFEGKKLGDIDGCIFAFCEPTAAVRRHIESRGVPTVLVNRSDTRFAWVANDADSGMRAIAALVARSRRAPRPCFVTLASPQPIFDARWNAMRDQQILPISPDDRIELASLRAISTADVQAILSRGYRSLICVNDLVAVAVADRLHALGARIPDDVALTGYDAAPIRSVVSRRIATVDLAVERLGSEAAHVLVTAVLAREQSVGHTLIPGDLIVGDSVISAPDDDERDRAAR